MTFGEIDKQAQKQLQNEHLLLLVRDKLHQLD